MSKKRTLGSQRGFGFDGAEMRCGTPNAANANVANERRERFERVDVAAHGQVRVLLGLLFPPPSKKNAL